MGSAVLKLLEDLVLLCQAFLLISRLMEEVWSEDEDQNSACQHDTYHPATVNAMQGGMCDTGKG